MGTEQRTKVTGAVVITVERCKGCGFCPSKALALSDQYNAKGYHPPMLVSQELCNGCNMCGLLCPDFAIYGFIRKKKTSRGADA